MSMLKSMRKHLKIVLWILLASFVLWGGSSAIFSSRQESGYAGTVFGKKVLWKEYEDNYKAVYNQARLMYGEKFNQVSQYLNLEQEAWMRIILAREADKRHIRVSDSEVITTVCNIPLFQDSSGRFIPDIYKRVVEYALKVSPREFEEEIKGSIKITKLKDIIIKDVSVSENELALAYKEKNEKAGADYALVSVESFKPLVNITDEKISQYYQLRKQELKTPARVNIEYIPFEYASYKTKNEAEDKASDVSYELAQEKQPDFYSVAKKFNLPVKESGLFSMQEPINGIGISYTVALEAFKLEPGQISSPIKSQNGRYIIRLKSKKDPYVPELSEIRQAVKDAAIMEEAGILAEKKATELSEIIKQKLQSGAKFKDACAELKLDVKSTGEFNRQGYIPELGKSEAFASAAFSAGVEKLAGVTRLENGSVIIFTTQKTDIDEEKFKAEKEEFAKTALQEKQAAVFERWFKDLTEKAALKISGAEKPKQQQPVPMSMPMDDF